MGRIIGLIDEIACLQSGRHWPWIDERFAQLDSLKKSWNDIGRRRLGDTRQLPVMEGLPTIPGAPLLDKRAVTQLSCTSP